MPQSQIRRFVVFGSAAFHLALFNIYRIWSMRPDWIALRLAAILSSGQSPPQRKQGRSDCVGKPLLDRLGRDAAHDGIGRNIVCHDSPGADNGPISDGHARQNDRLKSNPDIAADDNISFVVPCVVHTLPVAPTPQRRWERSM